MVTGKSLGHLTFDRLVDGPIAGGDFAGRQNVVDMPVA